MDKVISIVVMILASVKNMFNSDNSKFGIKDIKEALIMINVVSLFLVQKLKDGAQFSDALDFYNKVTQDAEFKKVITDAYDGYKNIPEQFSDIDTREGIELVEVQLEHLPKLVNEFKKK